MIYNNNITTDYNYKFHLCITNINNKKDAIWQGSVAVFFNHLHTDRRNNTATGSVGLNGLLLFLVPILPDTSSTSLLEITVKVASTISSFIANKRQKKGQNFHAGLSSASAEEQKNTNNSDREIPHKLLDGHCSHKASFHVIGARQRQWHVVCVFIRNHLWIWSILHFFDWFNL